MTIMVEVIKLRCNEICNNELGCSAGCVLVLLHVVNGKCHICLHQVLPSERSAILFLHGRFSVELGWCERLLWKPELHTADHHRWGHRQRVSAVYLRQYLRHLSMSITLPSLASNHTNCWVQNFSLLIFIVLASACLYNVLSSISFILWT